MQTTAAAPVAHSSIFTVTLPTDLAERAEAVEVLHRCEQVAYAIDTARGIREQYHAARLALVEAVGTGSHPAYRVANLLLEAIYGILGTASNAACGLWIVIGQAPYAPYVAQVEATTQGRETLDYVIPAGARLGREDVSMLDVIGVFATREEAEEFRANR